MKRFQYINEDEYDKIKAENAELLKLLKRVEEEFTYLCELDGSQYVTPDDELWSDIRKQLR